MWFNSGNGVSYSLIYNSLFSLCQQSFNALHSATRGTIGLALARSRLLQLAHSDSVPNWRRPIPLSNDFSNVLLVAFAPQPTDPRAYELLRKGTEFYESEYSQKVLRGTAIAIYTMAEVKPDIKNVVERNSNGLVNHNVGCFLLGRHTVRYRHSKLPERKNINGALAF